MTGGLPTTSDTGRPARLAALACALGTLLAALLLCAAPAPAHHHSRDSRTGASGVRSGPAAADRPVQGPAPGRTAPPGPAHVCSALDHDGGRSGCSGSSDQNADATLPGPPPQPVLTALSRPASLPASAAPGPAGPLPGSDLAPDLHLLQVLRT